MRRVLVVDDELDICLILSKHLRERQFEARYALTLKDARLKIGISTFALMFIDLNLTDGSGYEVINYTNELNLSPKIIVISAHDSEGPKALEMGAALFIKKPFTIKSIDEALEKLYSSPNSSNK
jgi:DNA-binding response OmpR family regulator